MRTSSGNTTGGELSLEYDGLRDHGSLVKRLRAAHVPLMADVDEATRWECFARIPGHPKLEARVTLIARAGQRIVESVTVYALERRRRDMGITADALRRVKLGKIQGEVTQILFREERRGRVPGHLLGGFRDEPRPGRRGRDEGEYAALAVRLARYAGSSSPTKDLAAELGESPSTIAARVSRARAKGFLEATVPGKANCVPTEKAYRVLRGEE